MASVKTGAIITDIRGKLGGHIFQNNGSGLIMSTKILPFNPQTPSQRHNRELFRIITQLWRDLTNIQRQGWREAAANFKSKDRFSKSVTKSGFWLFIKININLLLSGQNLVFDIPNFIIPIGWRQSLASYRWSAIKLNIEFDQHSVNSTFVFYATPMLSAGINNPLKYFRHLGNWVDIKFLDLDFTNEYRQHFTFPTENSNFFIGIKTVNASGSIIDFEYYNFFQTLNNQ